MSRESEIIYGDLPDATLVDLTLIGENRAFEELVIRYQRAVTASVYSVTRNTSLAEDIIQDAFVSAWMKLNTLKEPHKFRAWICTIARNKARNLVMKYQEHINFDLLENVRLEINQTFEDSFFSDDENDELHTVINDLSDKLRDVITLHYFENASVDEISKKLNLPAGTVKWRLHDGREKIRKGLGYMENNTKALVQSVLEKIEKVREWHTRDNKDGFEADYANAMTEIEKMPDTEEKYFNMAEIMQLGFWWLPGEKNSKLIEKIRDAAEKGKNYTVLGEIWTREADKYHGDEKKDYIINTLIPKMEKAGMTEAVGKEWFLLGKDYLRSDSKESKELGYKAYKKVIEILPKNSIYYANAISALRCEKLIENIGEIIPKRLIATMNGNQYLLDNGKLYYYKSNSHDRGMMWGNEFPDVFFIASRCDGIFYDTNLKVGESVTSYDGTTELTFISDNAEIETPCGKFDGCELWVTERIGFKVSVYYKRGVGIVYISHNEGGVKTYCTLKKYTVIGGDGLIPFCEGNIWEYESGLNPEHCDFEHVFEVTAFNGSEAVTASHSFCYRKMYSPDRWDDMILQIRREYTSGNGLQDVSFPVERANALASSDYQKAYTAAVTDTVNRILESDSRYTPDAKYDGRWNFFNCSETEVKDGKILTYGNFIRSFEWKGDTEGDAYPLLGNDIIGIIQDMTGCIWSDEWCDGASMTVKCISWMRSVCDITVEHIDTIEVAAGRFDDCLKVSLDIKGDVSSGLVYRIGKKEYYYSKGIGIIKVVHYFKDGAVVANYELMSYEGTGDGYMPVCDGLIRSYEAIGLKKGFIGKAEHTFCEDDGVIKIIENRTGLEVKKPFSPDDWDDVTVKMRKEYVKRSSDGKSDGLKDISSLIERSAELADTKYRKLHTSVASDVMKHIFEGDKDYTPEGKYTGHWNFFHHLSVRLADGKISIDDNRKYSFEWKGMGGTGDSGYPLLGNHVIGILQDAVGCIWSDEFKVGAEISMRGDAYDTTETDVIVESAGAVEVSAGRFDDCLKLTLNITDGWDYRTGKKEYYFAKGIGIVKCVHYFKDGKIMSTYELTSYKGTGDGYMPVNPDLYRCYEDLNLTDGFIGKAEYTFCENDDGELRILESNTGIKMK